MTMIDTADSRFAKAVAIADGAHAWLKCRAKDGKKLYGVPSQRSPGHYHLTTQTSCTCYDSQRRICKHIQAVLIHVARMAGKPMPAAEVLDGLEQLVIHRQGPVLDMILAAKYSAIHERFDETPEQIFGRVATLDWSADRPRRGRPPARLGRRYSS